MDSGKVNEFIPFIEGWILNYFVQKVIEQTKKSVLGKEEEDGEYMKFFGDILNEQYANIITDSGGVGLAKQLYDSMKDRYNL